MIHGQQMIKYETLSLTEDSWPLAVHSSAGLAAVLTINEAFCFVRARDARVQPVIFWSEYYFINLGANLHT
jgi:hypothetical protein